MMGKARWKEALGSASTRFSRSGICSNQHPIYAADFSIARVPGSRNQGVELGVAPITITPSIPLAKILFLVPAIFLCSAGLEVLLPEGGMFPLERVGDNDVIEVKVKTATWPLWIPHVSESTKMGVLMFL